MLEVVFNATHPLPDVHGAPMHIGNPGESKLAYVHTYISIYFIVSNHKFITNKADINRNNNILTWKSNININKQIKALCAKMNHTG